MGLILRPINLVSMGTCVFYGCKRQFMISKSHFYYNVSWRNYSSRNPFLSRLKIRFLDHRGASGGQYSSNAEQVQCTQESPKAWIRTSSQALKISSSEALKLWRKSYVDQEPVSLSDHCPALKCTIPIVCSSQWGDLPRICRGLKPPQWLSKNQYSSLSWFLLYCM